MFNTLYTDVADRYHPIEKTQIKSIKTPWMTSNLKNDMRGHDYHHMKAIKTNSKYHWKMFSCPGFACLSKWQCRCENHATRWKCDHRELQEPEEPVRRTKRTREKKHKIRKRKPRKTIHICYSNSLVSWHQLWLLPWR